MAISHLKAVFSSDMEKVWNTVTSLEDFMWRSDVSKIEVVEPGKKFIEYALNEYPTEFLITVFEPYKQYEFQMNNTNMEGYWTGKFLSENGKTVIEFTEDVKAKKTIFKPILGIYLRKQQKAYAADLKKALGE